MMTSVIVVAGGVVALAELTEWRWLRHQLLRLAVFLWFVLLALASN
ncbi:hypothetical protein [Chromobacterium violaceum]|nr:hypothetical protein [Chromobacterium violaceum]